MSRVNGRILSGFLFSLVGLCCVAAVSADAPNPPVSSKTAISRNFGKLPLSFEPNRGQASSAARYIAHGRNSTVYLTPDGATIVVTHMPTAASRRNLGTSSSRAGGKLDSDILKQVRSSRLSMKFPGAARAVKISGEDRLSGTANYFIGKDASQWRTKIPSFGKVRYPSLYPGVDVVFYGVDGKLEYDLLVSPGADISRVRLAFEGAKRLKLNSDGDLIAGAGGDQIVIHKPVIYQLDGSRRKVISGGFVRLKHGQVGLQVAAYDRARPLIVDPTITFATYVSGSSFDSVNWSAIDNSGNQYLTGMACSGDFPVGTVSMNPEYQSTYGGGCDAFVTVLNPSGTELIYSTYLGGNLFDQGNGIAVDGSGGAYVVGETAGNFPIAPAHAFQSTYPGLPIEGFVAKLSPDGSTLVYSSYLGGSQSFAGSEDRAFGVAVLPGCGMGGMGCNAYVVGQTPTCDFPTAGTPVQPKNAGYSMSGPGCLSSQTSNPFDAYVAEFSNDGTSLVYSTYLGGRGGDFGGAIAVDSAGDAFVTGLSDQAFGAPSLATTPGAAQPNFGGTADAFAVKLNPTGSQILYSTFLGGSGFDEGQDIVLDSTGDAFVSGLTYSIDFPTFGAHVLQATPPGSFSGWLAELNPTGGFVFSTYLGNLSSQATQRVALDGSGNIYVAGWANIPSNVPAPFAFQAVNPIQSAPPPSGVVLQSTDNGSTFHNSGFPLDVGSANRLKVDASTSNPGHTVYVGTLRSGLFVSTDDGNTFSPTSITGAVFSQDLDTNANPPTLYVGASTGFYSVVGTMVSSTPFTTPFATVGIDTTLTPSTIYVKDSSVNRLDTSTDGGQTFQVGISVPPGTLPNSIARDPNTGILYLGTNRGVLTSTGGAPFVQTLLNWTYVGQVLVDYNSNPSIVYATTNNNGVVWSTDGFNSTVNQPLGPFSAGVGDVELDRTTTPATVYAGTGSGVFISTDGGQLYQTTQLGGGNPFITALAIDPGSPNGIFAGFFLDTTPSVAEISPDGSTLLFSSLFGGSETGITNGLNASANGSIYLAGFTFAHDFPTFPTTAPAAFQLASQAQLSGFAVNISNTTVGAGSNQTASPNGGTTVTGTTSSGGTTSATTSTTNPTNTPLPAGDTPASQYTDITSSATYSGLITVCLNYNPAQIVDAPDLSLLHFVENQWANITTSNNTMTGVICGQASSLSPFVIAQKLSCKSVSISGSMEGNLQVAAGSKVQGGYEFTMPGSHPDAHVTFANAGVTVNVTCPDQSVHPLAVGMPTQTYDDALNSSAWLPSGNQYQGSVVSNACGTQTGHAPQGATFTAQVCSNDAANKFNLKFHYSDNSAGGWSGTASVTP